MKQQPYCSTLRIVATALAYAILISALLLAVPFLIFYRMHP